MARPYPTSSLLPRGRVEYVKVSPGNYKVLFTPPEFNDTGQNERNKFTEPIMLVDLHNKICTIYPFTVHGDRPISAKYMGIGSIEIDIVYNADLDMQNEYGLDDFLITILPKAFSEDFNYGLGFKQIYKPIISLLENFGINKLIISNFRNTEIDIKGKQATIGRRDLDKLCKAIDRITRKAQQVSISLKKVVVGELFAELITGSENHYETKKESAELLSQMGLSSRFMPDGATKKEQNDAMEVVRKNSKKMMAERPGELMKLKNDIELVSLQELVVRFECMLEKDLTESHWQQMFMENPFILNMALGVPIVKLQDQAAMGGMKFSGTGTKIADFLVKNSLSNNAGIIEIKTPRMKMLSSKPYRSGLHAPSNELNGAVSQVLDQVHIFQRDISTLKANSRQHDIETYHVYGFLVTGMSPKVLDEQKSFELFRGNSKNVQIITFDELLQKLKDLHDFFLPQHATKTALHKDLENVIETDLPF